VYYYYIGLATRQALNENHYQLEKIMYAYITGYGIDAEGNRFEIAESGKAERLLNLLVNYGDSSLYITIKFSNH
jgi:hypothetical protein